MRGISAYGAKSPLSWHLLSGTRVPSAYHAADGVSGRQMINGDDDSNGGVRHAQASKLHIFTLCAHHLLHHARVHKRNRRIRLAASHVLTLRDVVRIK